MAGMARDLSQNPVIFAERDGDQLAKTLGLRVTPPLAKLHDARSSSRARPAEFDPNHKDLCRALSRTILIARGHFL